MMRWRQFLRGCRFAALRFWCGVVGHLWVVDEHAVGRPGWCARCNWWGGFTRLAIVEPGPADIRNHALEEAAALTEATAVVIIGKTTWMLEKGLGPALAARIRGLKTRGPEPAHAQGGR